MVLRGGAPLVLLTDNGPPYRSEAVEAWCNRHCVLHLFTLPRTPQHNAASEHGMREIKAEAALGKGVRVHDTELACDQLVGALQRLDHNRLRATRGWRTAVEDDRARPSWRSAVDRQIFYRAASCAIETALLNSSDGRARRRSIREAILGTLEHFAVITRTRGGRT